MAELIDKNEILKKAVTIPGPSGKSVFSVVFTDDILNAKAIEPKTGHWIYDYTSADGHKTYHCSECGCYLKPKHSEPLNSFKWCSLCGADMRGEEGNVEGN